MWPGSQQNLAERLYIHSLDDPEAFLAAFNSKQILSKRGVPDSVTALFNSLVAAASHCFPDLAVYGITLCTSWNKKKCFPPCFQQPWALPFSLHYSRLWVLVLLGCSKSFNSSPEAGFF